MGLNRRDIVLLAAIWGMVAILLAGVLIVMSLSQAHPTLPAIGGPAATPTLASIYTPVQVEQTARRQYEQAAAFALGWRADAQLLSCRASWEQTAINLVGRPVAWTFRFYSPSSQRLYFVVVAPGGAVQTIQHVRPVSQPPPTLPLADWQLDSPAALANWLNSGGGAFLGQHAGGTVIAQLSVRAHGQPPQWTVAGYDPNTDETFAVVIDAMDGATAIAATP